MLDVAPAIHLLSAELGGLQAVYLFGSAARGDSRTDSDVDLAVLSVSPLDPIARWELQERVAACLRCGVDLVDLRSASAVLRVEVLQCSQVLLDADPLARASFEAFALSDYARLQEERIGILEDIRQRGRVYG